jgi:hypothetical protein
MLFGFKAVKPRISKSSSKVTNDIFEIVLEENNQFSLRKKWFSGQGRLESITDVSFYDDTHLIVANRCDCILYYIEFDYNSKQFKIIHSLQLYVDSHEQYITLFTIHNKKIYFTTLSNRISMVEIIDNKLKITDTFTLPEPASYHGITFDIQNEDIVYLTSASPSYRKFTIMNIQTKTIIKSVSLKNMENMMLKQTKFLDKNHIVICGCLAGVSIYNKNVDYDAYIGIYNVETLECVSILKIDRSQCDDMFIHNNKIHLTHQGGEPHGKILVFSYEDMKLLKEGEIDVFGFPHGIDFRNNVIACTSMINTSVSLFPYKF